VTDEALHFVSGAAEPRNAQEAASPFDLFARVLLGRAPDKRSASLVRWARSEASREVAAGRVPVAGAEVAAYRLLYRAARSEAAEIRASDPVSAKTRWECAIEGLATLRHRQRAGVALRFLAGLTLADVAEVLGVRETQARGIVESGIAGIVRAVGGPIDVRRALRVAAQRLVSPPKPAQQAPPPPVAMPRRVIRTLLAPPPLLAPMPQAARLSPVEALIAPLPEPATPAETSASAEDPISIPEPAAPPPLPAPSPHEVLEPVLPAPVILRPRRVLAPAWSREALPRRLAVAIAVALLCAVTLAPSSSPRPRPVAAPAGTIVATSAAFGDDDSSLLEARRLFSLLPAPPSSVLVAVRRGESLWTISARALGDARRWPELWRANRGRAMSGGERFMNPAVIRPGWKLALPGSA
jgi:nucleoid-associated protein YgaU